MSEIYVSHSECLKFPQDKNLKVTYEETNTIGEAQEADPCLVDVTCCLFLNADEEDSENVSGDAMETVADAESKNTKETFSL